MTFWEAIGTIVVSLGVTTGASFLPVGGGVEAYLIATSALLPSSFVVPLVIASAVGSVAAKTVIFIGAAKTMANPGFLTKGERRARIAARIKEGPWIRRAVSFAATTLSIPPYSAYSLVAGSLRTPLSEFIVISLIGQTLRFGAVWAIPQVATSLASG